MIAPHIRIEDVDEGGFALLEERVSRRDLGGGPQLHVLHESGTVVSVLHTTVGPMVGPHDDLVDLREAAVALRSEYGVERVVLLDADAFDAVEDVRLAGLDVPQPTLFATLAERFWSSPAVVADPPPGASRWRALGERLARAGDGHVLLVVTEGQDPVVRLCGALHAGLLTTLTTLDLAAPPTDVVLELRLTMAELDEVLAAPDVAAALLARPELEEIA